MTAHNTPGIKQHNFPTFVDFQFARLRPAAKILLTCSIIYLISFGLLDYFNYPDKIQSIILFRLASALPLLVLLSFMNDEGKHALIPKFILPLGLLSFIFFLSLNLVIPEKKYIVIIVPVFYLLVVIAMAPLLNTTELIVTLFVGFLIYYGAGSSYIHDNDYIKQVFPHMSAVVLFTLITVIKIKHSAEENYLLARDFHWQSEHDELTMVFNRNGVFNWIKSQNLFIGKSFEPISLVMLDLDHFKQVNDKHGHAVGDEVIKQSATLLLHTLGPHSVVARFGGEEFLLILQEGSESQNLKVALGVLEKFRETQVVEGLSVTVSMGFVNHRTSFSFEQSLNQADNLMYQAKKQGRDQVVSNQQ